MNAEPHEDQGRAEARQRVESGFLAAVAERIGSSAQVKAVFGDPVERDGITVIPVAKASWGVGGGGGSSDDGEGFGAGGGINVKPVGYLQIAAGEVEYRSLRMPLLRTVVLLGAIGSAAAAAVLLIGREK